MATRDLTNDFINLRNAKLNKPLTKTSSSKGKKLDDDTIELNYIHSSSSHAATEDPELGDDQQWEKQPQWVRILKGVQENMSNIKNGCM
ncbi:hypothetical protein D3C80_2073290 [compost metagenome]